MLFKNVLRKWCCRKQLSLPFKCVTDPIFLLYTITVAENYTLSGSIQLPYINRLRSPCNSDIYLAKVYLPSKRSEISASMSWPRISASSPSAAILGGNCGVEALLSPLIVTCQRSRPAKGDGQWSETVYTLARLMMSISPVLSDDTDTLYEAGVQWIWMIMLSHD